MGSIEVRETHISLVFLTTDRAYKLLKPVTTSFLDYSSRETRLAAAAREVELNRRLAPDVYLGLGELYEHGELTDHLIIMQRMPDERRLSSLVHSSELDDHLRAVAKVVAALHAAQQPILGDRAEAIAGRQAVGANWSANLTDLQRVVGELIDDHAYDEVVRRARRFLAGQGELFTRRITQGWVRDGHGDLLADDIYCLDDGPRILDCLAFSDELRIGDVLADIGFLAMDLHRLAGPEWARRLFRWYGEFSNEHHPSSLAHHYVAYRAHVRAKVAALRWEQGDRSAATDVRIHHALAVHHLRRGTVRLVLIGGLPGTGKTSLAQGIADALGAVALSSDEIRKDVANIDRGTHAFEDPDRGLYSPGERARIYDELLREADRLLADGQSVVLDASWSELAQRKRAESLAQHHSVDLDAIECVLDPSVARQRLESRIAAGDTVSDATPDVADHLRARWPAWPGAVHVDTAPPVEAVIASAVEAVIGVSEPRL